MNAKLTRSQRSPILVLVISIVVLIVVSGNMTSAKALTGFGKISPANGATSQPISLTLKWEAAAANPYGYNMYYKYCLYTSSGTCDYQGIIYTTQYDVSSLVKEKTYYWQIEVIYCMDSSCVGKDRVEANNGQVWSFTTSTTGVTPPAAFAKTSPANNATNLSSRVITWASSSGATSYQYCFSPTYGDTNCTYLGGWKDVGNVTTYTIPNDANFIWGARYYWQIRASNLGGTTLADSGTWWSFITADLVGRTTLISPTGIITKSTPTYSWNRVSTATWYYLWINNSAGKLFSQWYDASKVCGLNTCTVTPSMVLNQGNYTWWIETWNNTGYGPWSDSMSFNAPLPTPPDPTTLVSPHDDIGQNYLPTYTWNDIPGSSWYYLWVSGPSGVVISQWYTSADAHCNGATCYITPNITLANGAYTWKVQTWSTAGTGPWSAVMSFNIPFPAPPGQTTLIAPTGSATTTPTYSWTGISDATWYYLVIDGPSGNVLSKWYTSADAGCSSGTCSATPSTTLSVGTTYSWKVRTWNIGGWGPESAPFTFSTPALPGKATLSSPNGTASSIKPAYTWKEVNGATWYFLWISDSSGTNIFNKWYSTADAGCDGTNCSITPNVTLNSNSTYAWAVQTWNDVGFGPWSNTFTFTTPAPPGKATLSSPNGTASSNSPTYTWSDVSGSTWYYLWINDASGNIHNKWYSSTEAGCNGTTCSITPNVTLNSATTYTWWIQTWNDAGSGPWSNGLSFSTP